MTPPQKGKGGTIVTAIMPGYKLLLFDLDGTLLTPERRVDPRTLQAVTGLRERGLLISLATGRSPRSAAGHADVIGPNDGDSIARFLAQELELVGPELELRPRKRRLPR